MEPYVMQALIYSWFVLIIGAIVMYFVLNLADMYKTYKEEKKNKKVQ